MEQLLMGEPASDLMLVSEESFARLEKIGTYMLRILYASVAIVFLTLNSQEARVCYGTGYELREIPQL